MFNDHLQRLISRRYKFRHFLASYQYSQSEMFFPAFSETNWAAGLGSTKGKGRSSRVASMLSTLGRGVQKAERSLEWKVTHAIVDTIADDAEPMELVRRPSCGGWDTLGRLSGSSGFRRRTSKVRDSEGELPNYDRRTEGEKKPFPPFFPPCSLVCMDLASLRQVTLHSWLLECADPDGRSSCFRFRSFMQNWVPNSGDEAVPAATGTRDWTQGPAKRIDPGLYVCNYT